MQQLYDMIKEVTEFPEIYIGRPSLALLHAYIGGFLHQTPEANDGCLDGFNEFVYQRFHLYSDHNWASIIQFFSNSEKEAFDKFKTLFDEFNRNTNRKSQGDTDPVYRSSSTF